MKELIKKNIDGKKVLIFFILSTVNYVIMLTITIPKVASFSGGMKLLDMLPTGYNIQYVNSLMDKLGQTGRNAYLFCQIPFDMVYPSLFALSNCLLLGYFLKKLGKLESNFFYICFLPLLSGFFDYCENIGIITLLSTYPGYPKILVQITNGFSILKSSLVTITLTFLIIILIFYGINRLSHNEEKIKS